MRIKTFEAPSYQEALAEIKRDLGEDALILRTRALHDGSEEEEGPRVEIVAATEASPVPPPRGPAAPGPGLPEPEPPDSREAAELKALMLTLLSKSEKAQTYGLTGNRLKLFFQLVNQGVDERLASRILEKTLPGNPDTNPTLSSEKKRVRHLMARLLRCAGDIEVDETQPKKVVLVGPTGSGKTTTLAKLAAEFALHRGKRVALVSLDTYRLGAVDQLRIYGDIMQVPVEMACDRSDFRRVLSRHLDKDLILVDTTGRGPNDRAYPDQLREVFNGVSNVEVHLVLSVTQQENLLRAVHQQFLPLGIHRVLFTKIDEGLCFGPLFNFALRTRLPLSYLTLGQRVPEDIEVAEPDRVIRLIFN